MRSIILVGLGLAWFAVVAAYQRADGAVNATVSEIARSPETLNEVRLVRSGSEARELRRQLIADSERYLWITVPFWAKDESGRDLIERLRAKSADRDWSLRILQGWIAPLFSEGEKYLKSQLKPFIRYWNSPLWQRNFSFNVKRGHVHDKLFVSDDRLILGSRNVGDGYFAPTRENGGFFDLDLDIRGPAARIAAQNQLKLWVLGDYLASSAPFPPWEKQEIRAAQGYFYENEEDHDFYTVTSGPPAGRVLNRVRIPIRAQLADPRLFPPLRPRAAETVPVTLLHDNPLYDRDPETGKRYSKTLQAMQRLARSARTLRISTPYATFDPEMIAWLKEAARGGLSITIVTNSIQANGRGLPVNDMGEDSYKGAASHYPELLEAGIRIGEWQGHCPLEALEDREGCKVAAGEWPGHTLHAKVALFDDREFLLGSNNLNRQSLRRNSEAMAYVRDAGLAREVAEVFAGFEAPVAVASCGGRRFELPSQVQWIDLAKAKDIWAKLKITKPSYDYPLGN